MDIDPNVQVALVSVFATFITTLGVVAVAIINNRKERAKAAGAGVEAGLDEKDVLEKVLSLISENDRKEEIIANLRKTGREWTTTKRTLQEEIKILKTENEELRLKVERPDHE